MATGKNGWYAPGMRVRVTIDKFGRILLPKIVRDRMGLRPGTPLELETDEEAMSLRLLADEGVIEEEDGLLVFQGESDGTDMDDVLRDLRAGRIRHQGGQ